MHFLQRHPGHARRQVGGRRVQAVGDVAGIVLQQIVLVAVQVEHDDPVGDRRMCGQRQHDRRTQAAGRIALRDVQQRLHRERVEQAGDMALVAQLQCVLPQPRLVLAQQPGHAQGGVHVRQRLMGVALAHVVGQGQVFELERGRAVLAPGPHDPVRAQRMGQTQHVQQVPARIAVAPLAFIGVEEIAEQGVADELVVETQRVVTQGAGARARHFLDDACDRLGLGQALAQGLLRGDAGDQGGHRRGQQVGSRLHEQVQRLLDLFQCGIGADRGELGDAGAARIGAEGLQVVEQEAVAHRASSSTGRRACTVRASASQSMSSRVSRPCVACTRICRCTSLRCSASAYGMRMKVTML